MGVYIKDMEMPTRCGRCDMRISAYDDGMFDHYECCITAAIIDNLGEKMEDCPLLPVPPHGRLIDADKQDAQIEALIERHLHGYTKSTWDFVCELRDILKRNRTIIPAEEGE